MERWYLKSGEVESGPYSREELMFLNARNKLLAHDQLRQGTIGDWSPLLHVLGTNSVSRHPSVNPLKSQEAHPSNSRPTETTQYSPTDYEIGVAPVSITGDSRKYSPHTTKIAGGAILGLLVVLLVYLIHFALKVSPAATIDSGVAIRPAVHANPTPGHTSSSSIPSPPAELPPIPISIASAGHERSPESAIRSPTESSSRLTVSTPTETPATLPAPPAVNQSRFVVDDLRELDSRLHRESAKSGDVQVSLMWNNLNDVDLHVITPSGQFINFVSRRSACHGMLDVDMNAERYSEKPVENIFWPTGKAPRGKYKVFVHLYAVKGGDVPTPYQVYVRVNGQPMKPIRGKIKPGDPVLVTEFTY